MSCIWKVVALEYNTLQDELSNVVTSAQWSCIKEDDNGNVAVDMGSITFSAPDPNNFVEWENLEESAVVAWIKDAMGENLVNNIEAKVNAEYQERANASTGYGVPWPVDGPPDEDPPQAAGE